MATAAAVSPFCHASIPDFTVCAAAGSATEASANAINNLRIASNPRPIPP